MSGRIYDIGLSAICSKCGSEMWTSFERNYNGPKCKNKKCDGGVLEAIYSKYEDLPAPKIRIDKEDKYILEGICYRVKK